MAKSAAVVYVEYDIETYQYIGRTANGVVVRGGDEDEVIFKIRQAIAASLDVSPNSVDIHIDPESSERAFLDEGWHGPSGDFGKTDLNRA